MHAQTLENHVVPAHFEYDPASSYSYSYDVQDPATGDSKSQSETRYGDVVRGSYSLIEPDGTRRVVEYTADPLTGFNAIVNRHPPIVPVVSAPLVNAPVVADRAAVPLPYAAAPAHA